MQLMSNQLTLPDQELTVKPIKCQKGLPTSEPNTDGEVIQHQGAFLPGFPPCTQGWVS